MSRRCFWSYGFGFVLFEKVSFSTLFLKKMCLNWTLGSKVSDVSFYKPILAGMGPEQIHASSGFLPSLGTPDGTLWVNSTRHSRNFNLGIDLNLILAWVLHDSVQLCQKKSHLCHNKMCRLNSKTWWLIKDTYSLVLTYAISLSFKLRFWFCTLWKGLVFYSLLKKMCLDCIYGWKVKSGQLTGYFCVSLQIHHGGVYPQASRGGRGRELQGHRGSKFFYMWRWCHI